MRRVIVTALALIGLAVACASDVSTAETVAASTTRPARTSAPTTAPPPPPTVARTLAPTPAPQTAAPTQPPAVPHSVQLSVTSPVRRGTAARADASTTGGASCTITVTYASGPSGAQGLTPKTAAANGAVSWSWTVGTNTTRGDWPVDVTCTAGSQRASARQFFTVQ